VTRTNLSMSISADGYVAGPGQCEKHPLGDGGEALHEWHLGPAKDHPVNRQVMTHLSNSSISETPLSGWRWPAMPVLNYWAKTASSLLGKDSRAVIVNGGRSLPTELSRVPFGGTLECSCESAVYGARGAKANVARSATVGMLVAARLGSGGRCSATSVTSELLGSERLARGLHGSLPGWAGRVQYERGGF
jgi:hypothetical protein